MTPPESDSAFYRTLLESTRAIPWKIDWASATFAYIGPQIEEKLMLLQHELEDLSFRDGLTGVNNRRKFDAVLQREWLDARREVRPLSLLLFDVDFFKAYNDHYGHVEGDDCLNRVAQALASAAHRPRDFVARYGGEEFVLLLPASDARAARAVAERCRQAVFKAQIPHAASAVGQLLTVSVGADTIIPAEHDDPVQFLQEVDRRLYRAKHQGRNRMVDSGA